MLTIEEVLRKTPIKYQHLFDDPIFQKWLQKKLDFNPDVRLSSLQEYIPKLAEFLEFSNTTPSSLVSKVKSRKDYTTWKDSLDAWFRKLTSADGLTRKYSRDKLLVVLDFLNKHDLSLGYRLPGLGKMKSEASQFQLTFEILRDAFLALPPRDPMRFFILLMKDSGLSEVDILNLDPGYSHYDPINRIQYPSLSKQQGQRFITLALNRFKTDAPSVTFLGPEATGFLQDRKLAGRIFENWTTVRAVEKKFKPLQQKLNRPYLVLKSIRSLFDTTIVASGMNEDMAEIMMGHEIPDRVRRAYLRFGEKHLLEKYKEIYDELRLFPTEYESRLESITRDDLNEQESPNAPKDVLPLAQKISGSHT